MSAPTLRIGALPPIQVSGGTLVTVALLAVIVYPALAARGDLGPTTALTVAVLIGVFVIVSVLLHEAAHALTAHAFGARVEHIALTLWGGHTQYRAGAMGSFASAVVSLAGPATNAVLALLATALGPLVAAQPALAVFVAYAGILNWGLAIFNLLPGLPMDGGRAVEAILGGVLRRPALGTRITAWIGRAIAVAVLVIPLVRLARSPGSVDLLLLVWAVIIGTTLWQGATAALRGARLEGRMQELDPTSLARPVLVVPSGTALSELPAGIDPGAVLVLDPDGQGRALDPTALASVPPAARGATPVGAVSRGIGRVVAVPADIAGALLVEQVMDDPRSLRLLVDAQGRPRGLLSPDDLARHLQQR